MLELEELEDELEEELVLTELLELDDELEELDVETLEELVDFEELELDDDELLELEELDEELELELLELEELELDELVEVVTWAITVKVHEVIEPVLVYVLPSLSVVCKIHPTA